MRAWTIHLTVYVAVNALAVFVWLLTGGSVDALRAVVSNPTTALDEGFWPIWLLALGATAFLIHTGVALSNGVFGFQAQRRRRQRRKELQKAWNKTAKWAESLAVAKLESTRESAAERRERRREEQSRPTVGSRHWVAVMFTDIADSTPLTESLGDEPWREVLAEHRRMVRECVAECDGTEVSTQGDSFFVRFDDVATAVTCAASIQRRLDSERDGDAFVPEIRIGINAGEAVEDDGGDLLGHVVNLASRVTGAASGGEILITEVVADRAPSDVKVDDRGLVPLKGVAQPRHLLAVLWD